MSLTLPSPGPSYSADNEAQARRAIEREDRRNQKIGDNVEVGKAKLILTDPTDGARYAVSVDGGALVVTAL